MIKPMYRLREGVSGVPDILAEGTIRYNIGDSGDYSHFRICLCDGKCSCNSEEDADDDDCPSDPACGCHGDEY